LGINRDAAGDNPERIRIIFNSSDPYFEEAKARALKARGDIKGKVEVIIGKYSTQDGSISFNVSAQTLGPDLVPHIVHELVHFAQDLSGKYPDMRRRKGVDTESPWEKEAYRLMKDLAEYFERYCEIEDSLV